MVVDNAVEMVLMEQTHFQSIDHHPQGDTLTLARILRRHKFVVFIIKCVLPQYSIVIPGDPDIHFRLSFYHENCCVTVIEDVKRRGKESKNKEH